MELIRVGGDYDNKEHPRHERPAPKANRISAIFIIDLRSRRPVLVELSAGYGKKYDCGRVVSEARAWVMSNDQSWPFSFINVVRRARARYGVRKKGGGGLRC